MDCGSLDHGAVEHMLISFFSYSEITSFIRIFIITFIIFQNRNTFWNMRPARERVIACVLYVIFSINLIK